MISKSSDLIIWAFSYSKSSVFIVKYYHKLIRRFAMNNELTPSGNTERERERNLAAVF